MIFFCSFSLSMILPECPIFRYSPDDKSSSGCTSPNAERRRVPYPSQSPLCSRTSRLPSSILNELSHQESKMSSECSSDETVIYVVKSSVNHSNGKLIKKKEKFNTDDEEESHNELGKTLPKIYSAVNSVSSQDSGINLSFRQTDRSVDGSLGHEFAHSSSTESKFFNHQMRKKHLAPNDAWHQEDEVFFSPNQQHSSGESNAGEDQSVGSNQ